jgi:alkylation response protein AidB-like acyl-CoA dehydrogenase
MNGAFRDEVREWLAGHVPSEPLPSLDTAAGFERHRAWERSLAEDTLAVVTWPYEYGGRNASLAQLLGAGQALLEASVRHARVLTKVRALVPAWGSQAEHRARVLAGLT